MKQLSLLTFISFLFIAASCQSGQTKNLNSTNNTSNKLVSAWKKAKSGNISFQYPPDWSFEDETLRGQKRVTVTPNAYKQIKMVRAFEIIEITPSGKTFKDFKNNLIDIISNRGGSKAKLIKKEELKFKGYEAIYAEIIEDPKETPIPAKVYGVNKINKFYLITLLSREGDPKEPHYEDILKQILDSLTL